MVNCRYLFSKVWNIKGEITVVLKTHFVIIFSSVDRNLVLAICSLLGQLIWDGKCSSRTVVRHIFNNQRSKRLYGKPHYNSERQWMPSVMDLIAKFPNSLKLIIFYSINNKRLSTYFFHDLLYYAIQVNSYGLDNLFLTEEIVFFNPCTTYNKNKWQLLYGVLAATRLSLPNRNL